MTNVDYIVTAAHYCQRDGVQNIKQRIMKLRDQTQRKKQIEIRIQIDKVATRPVYARIELGQWIADCECRGCEFVDPADPIFFCFSCANRDDANMLRPVVFPSPQERMEIERLLLERPINDRRGLDDLERAHQAWPLIVAETEEGAVIPLTRTWHAGEPIENLIEENKIVGKWREVIGSDPVDLSKEVRIKKDKKPEGETPREDPPAQETPREDPKQSPPKKKAGK
jgi:hypothetical protein